MYPNIKAEMARKNITLSKLAEADGLRCSVSSLSQKLNGKVKLTFEEALYIKKALDSDLPLEELLEELA